MEWKIPLFKIYWDEEDVNRVTNTIKRGSHWAIGPNVEEFEKRIAEYLGIDYCLTFNSGTSALHAAMLAYGIKGDVLVPSFTFVATANAPLFVGANPVFTDIEETTNGMDPEDAERKMKPSVKAIIPIHYGGLPCRIDELCELAKTNDTVLIEDAAEALGAQLRGKMAGTFGDAGILSFCSNKIITTGEGGAVVTNDKDVYERMKLVRSHGRHDLSNYFSASGAPNYVRLGYNFRMSDITAALGLSQLEKIEEIIKMRRSCAEYMNKKLSKIQGISVPLELKGRFNVYQMYSIRLASRAVRDGLSQHLEKCGIMTKIFFSPVHRTQFYSATYGLIKLPVTENVSNTILSLPIFPTLTKEEMDYISDSVIEFMETVILI